MIKKRAFTLIELIVVLSIVAILISVIRINFIQSRKTLALEELNMISEQIVNARSYCISNKSNVKIISSRDNNSIKITSDGYYSKNIVCKYLTLSNSIDFNFNKNGVPDKGNSFNFRYKKNEYWIHIRPATGFVNVEK